MVITAAARWLTVRCPACGRRCARVHSRYRRTLADLPWLGHAVVLRVTVRRFSCDRARCRRRIFTEPLPATAARYARRTKRAAGLLQLLGFALGGRARHAPRRAIGQPRGPEHRARRGAPSPGAGVPARAPARRRRLGAPSRAALRHDPRRCGAPARRDCRAQQPACGCSVLGAFRTRRPSVRPSVSREFPTETLRVIDPYAPIRSAGNARGMSSCAPRWLAHALAASA